MRPEQRSQTLLGITRSKAKMFEYDVPDNYHITITQDPARLFTLSIGILGDLAARSHNGTADTPLVDGLRENLQFSARFFDAYMQTRMNSVLDPYVMILGAASFYLCDLPGSSVVLARRVGPKSPDLGGKGLEDLLRWMLQGNLALALDKPEGMYTESIDRVSGLLRQFFVDGNRGDDLLALCDQLRHMAYDAGTPRQLLLADVVCSVVRKKYKNSSWYALPEYTGLPSNLWLSALQKPTFIRELWPAQHLLGRSGVLQGKSAVVQMPTSAGKTRATELIIRSAFISQRTSLAVIVAPFRALCHEIKNSLVGAFRNEPVNVDELSDVMQGDFAIAELLGSRQVLVVTPEKFVYVLRHTPELAASIGVLIFDEGHQFDSGTRGITYELLITSLQSMLPAGVQKVLISAVISNADALGAWLNGAGSEIVSGRTLIPTFRTIAFASWLDQLGRLEFVADTDAEKGEFFVPRVIEQLPLRRKKGEKKDRVFPERSDGQAVALLLGFKLVKNGAVAIFCGRKTTAANLCGKSVDLFDRQVPLNPPVAYSDVEETKKLHYLHAQNLGENAAATRSSAIGIFSHHGNTPHAIRLSVEHAMREGLARFVICTSTLAQGVNLPIRYLLVTSVYQGLERIKVRDFHNLIGRAGRAGMHTEGSILFADPDVYDKRNDRDEKWRWKQVKELLEPANSEPCISALLSFFDPFRSDNHKYSLQLDAMDFVKRYFDDPATLAQLSNSVVAAHGDKTFTKEGLDRQISWKIDVISAIESFLMSHWDTTSVPLTTEAVAALSQGTLAYFLASNEVKARIVTLFRTIADNVGQKVADPERRKTYGKTLYGLATSQEIEAWVRSHATELLACGTPPEILDVLWPLLATHIQNATFRKCDKPAALKELALAWISGQPFNLIMQVLERQEARLIWGKTFRYFTIEHVVEMCESGLAYDGTLLIGAVIELATYTRIDTDGALTAKLQLFQKMLKYGLPTATAIAVHEAGFSDRPLVAELTASINLVAAQRRDVLHAIREHREQVTAILQKYPAYFAHIFNDVL
jgi:superfamily II DNA/RNA helicase